jgi:hypothetical protein
MNNLKCKTLAYLRECSFPLESQSHLFLKILAMISIYKYILRRTEGVHVT